MSSYDHYIKKANQHWEMYSLARQDCDYADADRHLKLAREYEEKAKGVK